MRRILRWCGAGGAWVLAACSGSADNSPAGPPLGPPPPPPAYSASFQLQTPDTTSWGALQLRLATTEGQIVKVTALNPGLTLVRSDSTLLVLGATPQRALTLQLDGPAGTAGVRVDVTTMARPDGQVVTTPAGWVVQR